MTLEFVCLKQQRRWKSCQSDISKSFQRTMSWGFLMLLIYQHLSNKPKTPNCTIKEKPFEKLLMREALFDTAECGRKNEKVLPIVGGRNAEPNEWPWQALVMVGNRMCGGTLIDKNWVLTAAHCVVHKGKIYPSGVVILGGHRLSTVSSSSVAQLKWTSIIIHHPHYNNTSVTADIALIKLSTPAELNQYVRLACLPYGMFMDLDFTQLKCVTSGFGQRSWNESSDTLKELDVHVVPQDKCSLMWALFGGGIHDNQICALHTYGSYSGACAGDSGGPLVCLHDGRYFLAGVTSYVFYRCRRGAPDVFTRVTSFMDWIVWTMTVNS